MAQQYTLILPIKIHSYTHDELQRFLYIQLKSLNKFLDIPSVHEFLIICKESEIDIIQRALSENPSPLPVRLISENTIVKQTVVNKTAGWYLQQILKLGVAKIVKTPVYLVLDSDCFLTKPLAYQDLFYQDKILLDTEPWTTHCDWWLDSLNIITEVSFADLAAQPVITVTPQILVTDIVCELLDYLSHKEKNLEWDEYLSTKIFTEFTLYWLFLLKIKKINLYQLSGNGPSLLGNPLWLSPWSWSKRRFTCTQLLKRLFNKKRRQKAFKMNQLKQTVEQIVKTSFENNNYFYFSLIQSNISEIPIKWIRDQTDKYLI